MAYSATAKSMDSLAPDAAGSRIRGWTARIPVSTRAAPPPIPNRTRSLRARTIASTPQNAETTTPANDFAASTGTTGANNSSGITASDGNGPRRKSLAVKWGSRLNTAK